MSWSLFYVIKLYIAEYVFFPKNVWCLSPLKLWVRTSFMARCTRYNIMWYSLSVPCDRSVVSTTNKTDRHDIIEMLLTVGLNAINHLKPKGVYVAKRKSFFSNNFLIYFPLYKWVCKLQGLQVGYHMLIILLQSRSLFNKLYVLKNRFVLPKHPLWVKWCGHVSLFFQHNLGIYTKQTPLSESLAVVSKVCISVLRNSSLQNTPPPPLITDEPLGKDAPHSSDSFYCKIILPDVVFNR
jgi:hypothetical protein